MNETAKPGEPIGGADAGAENAAVEPRRRLFALPDGSFGILLLVVFGALFGGLTASYWPVLFGADSQVSEERIAALETRVGQIATGRAGEAASGAFGELRAGLNALADRLTAAEARVTALEKGQPAAAAPGAPSATAPLRTDLGAVSATLAQLSERLARIERTGASAEQLAAFHDSIAKLQARVAALDADIARSSETHRGSLDAINGRLAKIEAALPPGLAERLETFAPRADLAASDARIARLETQNAGDTLHRAAAILALANLSSAAAEGRPFPVELEALAAAAPGDPAVATLRAHVAGVPTAAMLRARFPNAARAALDISRSTMATDVFSRLWANIESLISIRRVGDVAGSDTESRLARAQVRVSAGDISAAAAEVAAIPPPASQALSSWLHDARARIALDRTLAEMNVRVVHALAAAPATATAAPGPAPAAAAPVAPPQPTPRPGRTP
jgi:hypothetical protein